MHYCEIDFETETNRYQDKIRELQKKNESYTQDAEVDRDAIAAQKCEKKRMMWLQAVCRTWRENVLYCQWDAVAEMRVAKIIKVVVHTEKTDARVQACAWQVWKSLRQQKRSDYVVKMDVRGLRRALGAWRGEAFARADALAREHKLRKMRCKKVQERAFRAWVEDYVFFARSVTTNAVMLLRCWVGAVCFECGWAIPCNEEETIAAYDGMDQSLRWMVGMQMTTQLTTLLFQRLQVFAVFQS